MTKQELEDAILADLRDEMLYVAIAAKHRVGTNRVQELAKQHGVSRRRGKKLGTKRLTAEAVAVPEIK